MNVPCAACQKGSRPTRPASRWARPHTDTTRSQRQYTQRLSPATARPRWRSLALTCGLRMFSPLPWATPTPPHAQQAGADCTQTRHEAKLAHYGPHLTSLLWQNISYTPIVWSACGRRLRDTLTVSRSRQQIHCAQTKLSLPRLSIINFTPASPWKSGNAAPGKFGLVGHLRHVLILWTLNPGPCLGGPSPSCDFPSFCAASSVVLDCVLSCLFPAVLRNRSWASAMSLAESVRRLSGHLGGRRCA